MAVERNRLAQTNGLLSGDVRVVEELEDEPAAPLPGFRTGGISRRTRLWAVTASAACWLSLWCMFLLPLVLLAVIWRAMDEADTGSEKKVLCDRVPGAEQPEEQEEGAHRCNLSIYFRALHEIFLGAWPGDATTPDTPARYSLFVAAAFLGRLWWVVFALVEALFVAPHFLPTLFSWIPRCKRLR
jgi:hypothetical protein